MIGRSSARCFAAQHLTCRLLLTGFAGAFLAFSGLESISQLSPVMRVPRSKTVTRALTLVVLTVGITSPLLTIFSTVLLTDPTLLRTGSQLPAYSVRPRNPDQFISLLAGAYGGHVLAVLMAITASALLIFASNTAIIGAYHVFLALSRMRFFPEVVERTSKLRGTPHRLDRAGNGHPDAGADRGARATSIMLGDLYAFGLLGAFSLTCISLDIIRWRERRGEPHIGALEDEEADGPPDAVHARPRPGRMMVLLGERVDAETLRRVMGRVESARERAAAGRLALARALRPAGRVALRAWPDLKFYLGLLTTVLVVGAWSIDLKTKPLATAFGGGFAVLGVAVSVVHYRYQQERGRPPVFLMSGCARCRIRFWWCSPPTRHTMRRSSARRLRLPMGVR